MIDLSTIPWSAPEQRAGKTFRRAIATPEFMAAWRADPAPLKSAGIWLGAYSMGEYWVFKFEASGKPEEGKSEKGCKPSTKPAGRSANPEAKVSVPAKAVSSGAVGTIHRGVEPLTPTTGPLASSPLGAVVGNDLEKKSGRQTGAVNSKQARTSKATVTTPVPFAESGTVEKSQNMVSQSKDESRGARLIGSEKAPAPFSANLFFSWLMAFTPTDDAYIAAKLAKRVVSIETTTAQFYALFRRKDVRIAGMKVGKTNGQMICSMSYP